MINALVIATANVAGILVGGALSREDENIDDDSEYITSDEDDNSETEDENIMQLQIPKNRITGSAFMYDPPLVRYNDAKKIYEDYEVISDQSYSESTDLQELLSGEGFD